MSKLRFCFLATLLVAGLSVTQAQAAFNHNYVHAHWQASPTGPLVGPSLNPHLYQTDANSPYPIMPNPNSGTGLAQLNVDQNGGLIEIHLPNYQDELPLKIVHLDIQFADNIEPFEFELGVDAGDPEPWTWAVEDVQYGDHSLFLDLRIYPNPDWETIRLFAEPGTFYFPGAPGQGFDQSDIPPTGIVSVDVWTTSTVPEASAVVSWALMGLTGVGLVWWRRKRD